jgi:hypothetical protein
LKLKLVKTLKVGNGLISDFFRGCIEFSRSSDDPLIVEPGGQPSNNHSLDTILEMKIGTSCITKSRMYCKMNDNVFDCINTDFRYCPKKLAKLFHGAIVKDEILMFITT